MGFSVHGAKIYGDIPPELDDVFWNRFKKHGSDVYGGGLMFLDKGHPYLWREGSDIEEFERLLGEVSEFLKEYDIKKPFAFQCFETTNHEVWCGLVLQDEVRELCLADYLGEKQREATPPELRGPSPEEEREQSLRKWMSTLGNNPTEKFVNSVLSGLRKPCVGWFDKQTPLPVPSDAETGPIHRGRQGVEG